MRRAYGMAHFPCQEKDMKKPASGKPVHGMWQRIKDLNPNKMRQRHSCYRYTNPLRRKPV
jgi:hypothetical protein